MLSRTGTLVFFISVVSSISYPSFIFSQEEKRIISPVNNPLLNEFDLRAMAVDKKGNLWFATERGIIRYDGNEIIVFDKREGDTNTMANNSVGRLRFDKDDNLVFIGVASEGYLNTKTGKVNRFKIQFDEKDRLRLAFPYAYGWPYIDDDKTVWLGIFNIGFVNYNPATQQTRYFRLYDSLPFLINNVYSIKANLADKNKLWLATNKGIYSFDKKSNSLTRNFKAENPADSTVHDENVINIIVENKDTVWFSARERGIGCYDVRTGRYRIFSGKDKITGRPINLAVSLIQRKNSQEFYIANKGLPGVFNYKNNTYSFIFKFNRDYPSVQLDYFGEDSLKNLWCVSFYQLYRAEKNNKLSSYLAEDASPVNNMRNAFKLCLWDSLAKVYYAIFWGRPEVLMLDERMQLLKIIPIEPAFSKWPNAEPYIFDALIDKNGNLWVAGSALWLYDKASGKLKVFTNKNSPDLRSLFIQNLTVNRDHIYMQPASNFCNAVYKLNVNTLTVDSFFLPKVNIPEKSRFYQVDKNKEVLELDTTGKYAFVCYGLDLYRFNLFTNEAKKIFTLTKEKKAFPHIYNMFWYKLDGNNNLWVATMDGIKIYESESLKIIREIPRETEAYPLGLFHVAEKKLMSYVYSKGIILYDYVDNKEYKLTPSDGLTTIENYGFNVSNNKLFVGTYDLFHYSDIDNIIKADFNRRCFLSKILLFNKPFKTDSLPEYLHILNLPHNKNSVSLTFSSTEFDQPERLEYRYKLTGVDKEWVYVNFLNRTIFYNSLVPGQYRFLANVKNPDGTWSEEGVDILIVISPAWWQTNTFKVLAAFLIIGFATFLIRMRIQHVRKKERQIAAHEKELLELEAKALRAQMHPHFIFNCLNSIKSLMQENQMDKGVIYLTTFSKLIRTLFNNADKKEISLYDEIETCKLYLQLEAMRFDSQFSYNVNIDETIDLKSISVPALIIQPFIENAIWHGIVPKGSGGNVSLDVSRSNGNVEIVVDDNGIGRESSQQNKGASSIGHQSKGVNLTQSRLELDNLLQQRKAKLETIDKRDENGKAIGTKVSIILPQED